MTALNCSVLLLRVEQRVEQIAARVEQIAARLTGCHPQSAHVSHRLLQLQLMLHVADVCYTVDASGVCDLVAGLLHGLGHCFLCLEHDNNKATTTECF
jgi:hypothetical protein